MKKSTKVMSLLLAVIMTAGMFSGISLPASAAEVAVTDGMPFKTNAVNIEKMTEVLGQAGESNEPYGWSETEAINATNGLYAIIKLPVGAKVSRGRLWGTWSYADHYIICGSTDDAVYNGDNGDPAHSSWVQIGEYIDPNAGTHSGWTGGTNTNVTSTDTTNAYTYIKVQLKAGCNIDPNYTRFAPRCFCVYGEFTGNVPVGEISAINGDPGHPIAIGTTGTLTATVVPAAATNQAISWSSDNACVSIDQSTGNYTAVSEGTATINATSVDGGKTKTLQITVADLTVTGVEPISGINPEIEVGNTGTVSTRTIPYYAANPTIIWSSSDPEVLTINSSTGAWSAISSGNVRITATSQADSAYYKTIDVAVLPHYDNLVLNKNIKVQSYGSPIYVLNDGNRGGGAFNADGNDHNFPFEIVFDLGAQTQFNKVFHQAQTTGWDTYMNEIKIYGSNDDAVFTTAEGADQYLLTEAQQTHASWVELADYVNSAHAYDVSTILSNTASYRYVKFEIVSAPENFVRMMEIEIYNIPYVNAESVSINNPVSGDVEIGDTGTLIAVNTPANTTYGDVEWSSSNSQIVEIDPNTGVWIAKLPGSATITATNIATPTASGSTTINVVSVTVEGVVIVGSADPLATGSSRILTATVSPDNATDKTVFWSSSDSTAVEVSEGGTITAKRPNASAVITATTRNGLSDSVTITTTGIMAQDIGISGVPISAVSVGDTNALSAVITPSDASVKDVRWTSSVPGVVTIDENSGVWTAISGGVSIITVETTDGSNLSNTATIYVGSGEPTPSTSTLNLALESSASSALLVGDTFTVSLEATGASNDIAAIDVLLNYDPDVLEIVPNGSNVGTISSNFNFGTSFATFVDYGYENGVAVPGTLKFLSAGSDSLTLSDSTLVTFTFRVKSNAVSSTTLVSFDSDACKLNDIYDRRFTGNYTNCNVNIDISDVDPVSVTVSGAPTQTVGIGVSGVLLADILPAFATNDTVTWASDNKAVYIEPTTGKWIAIGAGTANITVTTANGLTDSVSITVDNSYPLDNTFVLSTDNSNPYPGREFNVYVNVQNLNTDIIGIDLTLLFDSNVLEIVPDGEGKVGSYNSSMNFGSGLISLDYLYKDNVIQAGGLRFLCAGSNSLTMNGSLVFSVRFRVKPGAQIGDSLLRLDSSKGLVKLDKTQISGNYTNMYIDIPDFTSVTSIQISGAPSGTVEVGAGGGTLTATVTPDNATDKTVTWSSSNTSVVTIDSVTGAWTAVGAGTSEITATAADGSGVTAKITITVTDPGVMVLLGDIDRNGEADILDAISIFCHVAGKTPISGNQLLIGDIDQNGSTDILDAVKLFRHIAGKAVITQTIKVYD